MPVLSMHLKATALAAFAAVVGPAASAVAQDRSPIVDLSPADAEMNAAIAKARATLPAFWASYEAPKPSEDGHSLKVSFPKPRSGNEHIWMAEVKKLPDGRYSGRFANQPRDLPGKRIGDTSSSARPTFRTGCFCATARSSAARPSGRR
jgi:hypothetical protein